MKYFRFYFFFIFLSLSAYANPSDGLGSEVEKPPDGGTIEAFLQSLSTIPDVVTRRDPFIILDSPFKGEGAELNLAFNPNAPVLERYPIEDYTLVAALTGDEYPRALVRLPDTEGGRVLIVKQKDKLGNRGGVITSITKDNIVVHESKRSPLGFVEKATYSLKVGIAKGKAEQK